MSYRIDDDILITRILKRSTYILAKNTMLILLSPSKTLDFQSPIPSSLASVVQAEPPLLLAHLQELAAILRHKTADDLKQLMAISDALAQLNYQRFQDFSLPFTANNSKPCLFAFKGDVYEGLDAESLTTAEVVVAQQQLRILSGFYGVLRPFDTIQPYRLEMGTKLVTPRGKNLYNFWGNILAETLYAMLMEQGKRRTVNLASEEYFRAIRSHKFSGRIITPVFKEKQGSQLRIIGIFAKRARGLMARYILQNQPQTSEDLQEFAAEGYRFVEHLSNETTLTFVRA
jgi:cytoplasmic iron level regulating protein YaaA (DUF328/UPF0246 family)